MRKDKPIKVPDNEVGMSGYTTYAWKLYESKQFTMAQAELADKIMREEGYRKQSENVVEIVRCKDCKYANFVRSCSKYMCEKGCGTLKYSTDFCNYGEAKMKSGAE